MTSAGSAGFVDWRDPAVVSEMSASVAKGLLNGFKVFRQPAWNGVHSFHSLNGCPSDASLISKRLARPTQVGPRHSDLRPGDHDTVDMNVDIGHRKVALRSMLISIISYDIMNINSDGYGCSFGSTPNRARPAGNRLEAAAPPAIAGSLWERRASSILMKRHQK